MSFGYHRGQLGPTPTYHPVGGNEKVPRSTSPRNEDTLIEGEPMPGVVPVVAAPAMTREMATGMGYTGDACIICQSLKMVHTGHCNTCQECGATTGCS